MGFGYRSQAVRRAIESDLKGADIFIIANADTVMSRPNQELIDAVYPCVEMKKSVAPNETLLCIDKARQILGYEPQYSWHDTQSIEA